MAEPRQASAKILRSGVNAMRTVSSHAAETASSLATHAALRRALAAMLLLALLALAVASLGRVQLWMTGAGLVMVALSVASAVQEFAQPKTATSFQDFLHQEMDKRGAELVTLPHVAPAQPQHEPKDDVSAMALNIATPAVVSVAAPFPSSLQDKMSRRESEDSIGALESAINAPVEERRSSAAEVSNKLDVLHCGTVIDIQGSHGFIIPHDLCVDAKAASKAARSGVVAGCSPSAKQHKMPLVIPFNLNEEQAAVRQEIAVGKTVEFAYTEASDSSDSPATVCAQNVTPVPTDDGIAKSRSVLQSCKQAREVSFARAMEELTMISPRNVPVKHHVDLIKYAEKLDDHDAPFDQFI
ncbi:unnamed protein product [Phytophthora fragariaefolia]|uniref:Unnamed protein product n=1 Tax=Phytophthora fragariaefolia TaxID=1490495 RepID=A0A9W6X1A0_9STRA|nr:unnamed protein product [Phytophthora fragariaefolia]